MHYHISYQNPHSHYIDINFEINDIQSDKIKIQLPAWRPGRYELANFAKNIQKWEALDSSGNVLKSKKLKKDLWEVECKGLDSVSIRYNYFANELNAGSTFLDAKQLYINGVNCFLYVPDRINEPCSMSLDLPENYQIACGLNSIEKFQFEAKDFHELVDCPLIASADLIHETYKIDTTTFYLWFQGECKIDFDTLIKDFKTFSKKQMELFQGFPTKEYHFLFQILPHKAYHGVEHSNSTVCLLGPSYQLMDKNGMYKELLGVSSHELFHTWNIKRIRPVEMWPYDYSQENYSRLGYLAEGATTLYGDLMLLRSKVFTLEEYFETFNQLLDRHFNTAGVLNLSVADSSFDTWLDGYTAGIPNRKSSIYTEGALITFMLDMIIRKQTDNQKSFDEVILSFYQDFYLKNKGISEKDYFSTVNDISTVDNQKFFENYVNGFEDYTAALKEALNQIGLTYDALAPDNLYEAHLGFKIVENDRKFNVTAIYPNSVAEKAGLAIGDELISINSYTVGSDFNDWCQYFKADTICLQVKRIFGKIEPVVMKVSKELYYKKHKTKRIEKANAAQIRAFEKWSS